MESEYVSPKAKLFPQISIQFHVFDVFHFDFILQQSCMTAKQMPKFFDHEVARNSLNVLNRANSFQTHHHLEVGIMFHTERIVDPKQSEDSTYRVVIKKDNRSR